MYKFGMWLRFFLMIAAFSFIGVGTAWAQSSEPAFRAPEWRVIAQYYDDGANRAYYASTPGDLPLFATAEEACEAGANYVLPRLGEYSDNLSPGFQPGMAPSGVRPFGEIDYILNGNLYRSTMGRKCSVDGWERGSSGVSEYDIFEGGQRITTVETLESGSGNISYLFRKVWVGSIAAIPDCNNDGTLYILDGEPTCVSGGSSQYRNAPDCEGAEGDSPKSTPPKKCAGNPIALDSGAKQQQDLDYATVDGLLGVARKYRSNVRPTNLSSTLTEIPGFGTHWRGLTPGRLTIHGSTGFWKAEFLNDEGGTRRFGISADESGLLTFDTLPTRTRLKLATVQPYSGSIETFVSAAADPNGAADLRLSYANGDYILFRAAGSFDPQTKTRHYVAIEHGLANGYRRWFDYPDAGQHFSQVRDSLGRQIGVQWTETGWASTRLRGYYKAPGQPSAPPEMTLEKAIGSITLPDGTSLAYGYGASTPSGFLGRLETARRLDASQNVLWARTYLYEDTRFPAALTGTLDQNGARLSTYAYDDAGNATLTERAGGFDRQQVVYSQGPESPENYGQPLDIRDLTNPLGLTTRYTYSAFSENYSGGESPGPDPRSTPRRLLKTHSPATLLTPERIQGFEYDEDGLQIARTDANGGRMAQENIPDEGRPSFSTDANGVETQIEWHPTLDLPTRQTRKNLVTDFTYSAQGQLTAISRTDTQSGTGRAISMTYGAAGRLETINGPRQPDAEGRDDVTVMTYDAQGNRLTMANALGHLTRYEGYDPNGRPARMIDANGIATDFTYDGMGRIKTTTVKHPDDVTGDAITTFDYDVEGRVTAITRPDTTPLRFDYNLAGLMVAMRSDDGERVDYSHDPMGNVISETVKRSDGTQSRAIGRTFDELGRLLTLTMGPDRTTRFQYDKVGNPIRITSARGNAVEQAFDPINRLVSTLAPDGGKSSYGYAGGVLSATGGGTTDEPISSGDGDGPANELGAFRDPNGVTTRFVRNAFGQVTEEVSPDRGAIRYEYDAAGDLAAMIDGRGQRIVYVRDILGRVVSKTPVGRPASEQVTYIYDTPSIAGSYAIGRLSRIDDGSGATRFGYDHRGNLTTRFQKLVGTPDWVALRYRYDLADRIDLIIYPSGRQVLYVRDIKGRVASVRTRASAAVTAWTILSSGMSYEAFGSLKAVSFGNGERMVASYGDDGRLDGRRLYRLADGTNISHLAYGYDADDNMVRITDRLNADNSLTYAYDEVGRLKRVTTASGDMRRTDYVFDANGNRTRELRRPLPEDPASAATTDRYTFAAGSNRLARVATASGNRDFTFDARGNLAGETRPGGIKVNTAYDGYGRLTGYSRSSEADLTHIYNGMDDRVATTTVTAGGGSDTRRFVYAPDGRVLGEYGTSAADVKAEFIWLNPQVGDAAQFGGDDGLGGYMPLAVATADPASGAGATQISWVHASHMGVPLRYSDASGNTLNAPTGYSVPGFPGQSRTLADLYYNRYRDYDPTTGRYIQADPIGLAGGTEPYGYAMNNPLRYSDPTGEFVPLVILGGIALGAGSELAIQAGMNWWDGRDVLDANCYDWGDVAIAGGIGGFTGGLGSAYNAARTSGRVAAGATDDAFSHGLQYAERVRIRGLQDPMSHNFPYSFDDLVIAGSRNPRPNGYNIYRASGAMNGRQGVFEIGVNRNGVIDHRFFRPGQ